VKTWNDEAGDWQDLPLSREAPHYEAIARIVNRFCPNGTILDVGCGEAGLRAFLPAVRNYLGIEPSKKAAESARAKCPQDRIVHITSEEFDAGQEKWDCIVFNEMLYYTTAPLALLRKFARLLEPQGLIVISIVQIPERSFRSRIFSWIPGSKMTNIRCTKVVHKYMIRNGWTIEVDDFVPVPGTEVHWRILAAAPGMHAPNLQSD
jgi:2-polyprenyl-3-methyl-5-hydroxy-6-metoxy-1,4-benzoquinol methylase